MTDEIESPIDYWTLSIFDLAGKVHAGEMSADLANLHLRVCMDLHRSQSSKTVTRLTALERLKVTLYDIGLSEKEVEIVQAGLRRGKMKPGKLH